MNVGFGDEVVVTFEPVIAMLANVGDVMTSFNCTNVIDHSKKGIPIIRKTQVREEFDLVRDRIRRDSLHIFSGSQCPSFLSIRGGHIIIYITTVGHKRGHV